MPGWAKNSLLAAGSTLADYDAKNERWESVGGKVAQALVSVNPVFLGPWLDAFRPVRSKLNAALAKIFLDKKRPETEHTLATNILADYAIDDPNLIADLVMDADPKAYAAFFPMAAAAGSENPSTIPSRNPTQGNERGVGFGIRARERSTSGTTSSGGCRSSSHGEGG